MGIPSLLVLDSEDEYREHYKKNYCYGSILTPDDYSVTFRYDRFKHAFSKSIRGHLKGDFCFTRARRMDWIKYILETHYRTVLHEGWIWKTKKYSRKRRAALYYREYVVVINIISEENKRAIFNTAYPTGSGALNRIENAPLW